ncbi:MAG: nucleotidyltransferase family protein [Gemmatimonadota bacterium]|nr:nucleotidyltransferase family protein [Gemmatimonadota bacterium]
MIAGVVLAAGRSRRMGSSKPLLTLDGESFLARVIGALRSGGCDEVVVVTGPADDDGSRLIAAEASSAGGRVIVNPVRNAEQLDSLRVGLSALAERVEAALVTPADLPGLDAATVGSLIRAFRARRMPIVLPTFGGAHGHPGLFSREVWPELFTDPLPEGARSVIRANPAHVEEVAVENDRVLLDVDTPADLRRLLEGDGER